MIFVTGGSKSGKSSFAEQLVKSRANSVLYIATARDNDDEMVERIKKHKERRPKHWDTYEGYLDLYKIIEENSGKYEIVILECVTAMVNNLMSHFSDAFFIEHGVDSEEAIDTDIMIDYNTDFNYITEIIKLQIQLFIDKCIDTNTEIIVVTNEVGLGIRPENKFVENFRDIAGIVNQMFAEAATEAYFLVSGIPVPLK